MQSCPYLGLSPPPTHSLWPLSPLVADALSSSSGLSARPSLYLTLHLGARPSLPGVFSVLLFLGCGDRRRYSTDLQMDLLTVHLLISCRRYSTSADKWPVNRSAERKSINSLNQNQNDFAICGGFRGPRFHLPAICRDLRLFSAACEPTLSTSASPAGVEGGRRGRGKTYTSLACARFRPASSPTFHCGPRALHQPWRWHTAGCNGVAPFRATGHRRSSRLRGASCRC